MKNGSVATWSPQPVALDGSCPGGHSEKKTFASGQNPCALIVTSCPPRSPRCGWMTMRGGAFAATIARMLARTCGKPGLTVALTDGAVFRGGTGAEAPVVQPARLRSATVAAPSRNHRIT